MKPVFVAAWVLPVLELTICLVVAARKLPAWLERLFDWEPGKWWPVLAAILPALIPIARSLEEDAKAPSAVKGTTVAGLLLAVAVLQLYGQERNNRDRLKTENRFIDLFNEIREGRTAISSIGFDVSRIANGIATLAAEAEEAIEEEES